MGNISATIMYYRGIVEISHHKKHDLDDTLFEILEGCRT
jgi:hypothetical protein